MKVKVESEKVGLKLNIQKTKIMISGPITWWQIDGETVEIVRDFIFVGSKITANSDWSHEIKWCLLLGRKVMTNLDNVLKSRDITLPTKVHLVKAMVFPVVMYGYESWTIKKPERWRIDVFELSCWRRLLRVPWTATRSNQSILKEIILKESWVFIGRTDVKAETPILWPTDAKNWLIWKDPDAGKDEGRRRGRQRMRWHHRLSGHEFEQALGDGEGQRSLACCSPWGRKDLDMTEWLNNFLLGFPGWVVVKNLPANAGDKKDPGVIAESERFPGIGNGNPFQYSCLENSIDRGVWWSSVHGVANSWTPRSD